MALVRVLQNWSFHLLLVFLTGVVLLASPLILICFGGLVLYRFVISKVARWMNPSLVKLLPRESVLYSAHTPYTSPIATLAIVNYLSGGPCERDRVVRLIEENITSPKATGGRCLYPELQQRIVTSCGFQFWATVKHFSVEKHVRYYFPEGEPPPRVGHKEIMEIQGKLLATPFNSAWSPWEVVIINNFQDASKPAVNSVLILRGHHCFMDGFTAIVISEKLASSPFIFPIIPEPSKPSIFLLLASVFVMPYETLKHLLAGGDDNLWTRARVARNQNRIRVWETEPLSLDSLKELKSRWNVSLTCVINTIFLGGVLKLMKVKQQVVPGAHLTLPMLLPGHPDKMRNHYSTAVINVTIVDDTIKLLKSLDASLRRIYKLPKVSQLLGFPYLSKVVGSLPVSWISHPRQIPPTTFLLSNFQTPSTKMDVCGYPIEELSCGMTPAENTSFACVSYSYNGSLKLTFFADQSVLEEEEDLSLILEGMKGTLDELMV